MIFSDKMSIFFNRITPSTDIFTIDGLAPVITRHCNIKMQSWFIAFWAYAPVLLHDYGSPIGMDSIRILEE